MKKTLLSIIFIIALAFVAMQFVLVPKAEKEITTYFTSIGFKNIELHKTKISLNGITIDSLTLDKDKFNIASNVHASIFWPTYILQSKINSISIENLKISSVANTPKDILTYKYFLDADKINSIATENITIKKMVWDIATPQHALRIEGNLSLQKEGEDKKITANLNAAQHEFSLNSQWSGTVQSDGQFNIEGIYDTLNIRTKSMTLNRGTGFIAFEKTSEASDVTAQLDAGSGNLLGIPIKNINLLLSQEKDAYPLLLRASASGLKDTNLYGDFKFSKDIKNQAFDLMLEINNPSKLSGYLKQQNIISKSIGENKISTKKTNIHLTYLPENRFTDGPFPFELNIKELEKEALKGTFLIYPDSLDIRGNAQGESTAINLLNTIFPIKNSNISEGNLRFDNNIKNLF